MADSINKALIIRFSSVGDVVLSSLLVRAFRSRFPEARIDFAVKQEYADLVRFNPHISGVKEFPAEGTFADLKRLRSEIQHEHYDLIVDIHDSLRSRFLSVGAKHVVRINKRKFARFLLVRFKLNVYSTFGGAPAVALRYLEPVHRFGVTDDGKGLELFFSESDETRIRELIQSSGFESNEQFIGVCPSAKHNNKMWLKERFADAAAALSRQHNRPIVIFGSEEEREHSTAIEQLIMKPDVRVLNLAGKLSLTETAAMMDYCSVVITNDTGLMHVASARKRNVVAIFGPTVKEFGFFPFGTNSVVVENKGLYCRPCTHIGLPDCPEGHFKCM
ncbi:MAG: glycosyltransferase family 9 protein, partial [bacterium]